MERTVYNEDTTSRCHWRGPWCIHCRESKYRHEGKEKLCRDKRIIELEQLQVLINNCFEAIEQYQQTKIRLKNDFDRLKEEIEKKRQEGKQIEQKIIDLTAELRLEELKEYPVEFSFQSKKGFQKSMPAMKVCVPKFKGDPDNMERAEPCQICGFAYHLHSTDLDCPVQITKDFNTDCGTFPVDPARR